MYYVLLYSRYDHKWSHFPSGGKGIISTAVGDIAAGDAIFAASKGSVGDVSLFISA